MAGIAQMSGYLPLHFKSELLMKKLLLFPPLIAGTLLNFSVEPQTAEEVGSRQMLAKIKGVIFLMLVALSALAAALGYSFSCSTLYGRQLWKMFIAGRLQRFGISSFDCHLLVPVCLRADHLGHVRTAEARKTERNSLSGQNLQESARVVREGGMVQRYLVRSRLPERGYMNSSPVVLAAGILLDDTKLPPTCWSN